MTARRPLADLFIVAMQLVAIWTIFGLFNSSELYLLAVDTGYAPNQMLTPILCNHLTSGLVWAFFTPFIAFLAERLPLVQPFRWRNALAVLAVTPVLAVIRAAFGAAVMPLAEGWAPVDAIVWFMLYSIEIRFHRNVFLILVIVGVVNLILAQRAAAASERRTLDVKRETANAELQRLRAVVQPHFLFATLDTVRAQVARAPLLADRMLVRLAMVLRKMLEFERRDEVSLREELQLVEHCLGLERTRTEERFTTAVDIEPELLRARVPPLLLQTLVESALAVAGPEEGHLAIGGSAQGHLLRIEIRTNDLRRAPSDAAIETTRARLRRAFADRATIERSADAAGSVTAVTMPLALEAPPGPPRPGDWTIPECRAQ